MTRARPIRSPFAVTLGVWKALFLRAAMVRLASNRFGWIWILLEPVIHIAFLMWIFYIGFRQRQIAGGDVSVFIMLGVLGFFVPRSMLQRGGAAVGANEALYAFRNVWPIDAVIARAALESLLAIVVFIVVCAGAAFIGFPVYPVDALGAIEALAALWLAGLALALLFSVFATITGYGRVPPFLLGPLYIFSAVMYPSIVVPHAMREILLYNPLVHGVESLRVAFMPGYLIPAAIDLAYLVKCSVVGIFLGLALHVRYQERLASR